MHQRRALQMKRQLFYNQVSDLLRLLPRQEINTVMDDFNAKIGKMCNDDDKHIRKHIGNYTFCDRNRRTDKLI